MEFALRFRLTCDGVRTPRPSLCRPAIMSFRITQLSSLLYMTFFFFFFFFAFVLPTAVSLPISLIPLVSTISFSGFLFRFFGLTIARLTIARIPSQDFNNGLSNPLPGVLEGLKKRALPSHLHDHSLHNKDSSLAFCHFAAEFKRLNGNLYQATYQAAYDGAVLVYVRDRALTKARCWVPQAVRPPHRVRARTYPPAATPISRPWLEPQRSISLSFPWQ
jgi:hypothetical protein